MSSSLQHLIEKLSNCPLGFEYGIAMVHGSGQIGVRKSDPAEGACAELAGGRLTIPAKKKKPGCGLR